MNRYPFWKYALIAVAVAIGFLYTLPNFFPEDPAVQVSSSKTGVKLDAALLQNVEDTLKGAGIPFRGAVLDATGVKVRFDDPDTQLKAKDAPDLGRFDWDDPFWIEDQLTEAERMLRDAARALELERAAQLVREAHH